MKVKIIYWSGTGNTEKMANAIFEGAKEVNDDTTLINVCDAKVDDVKDADVLIFGCPAMGSEELEEEYMRPYMDSVNELLKGQKSCTIRILRMGRRPMDGILERRTRKSWSTSIRNSNRLR